MTTQHDKLLDPFFALCENLSTDEMREVSDALSDEAFARDRNAREDRPPVTLADLPDRGEHFMGIFGSLESILAPLLLPHIK